jgi:hypothetical protein
VAGSAAAYAYGQALVVQGDIPPAAASVRVRGTFVLPVGVLSSECLDLQQVGFMSRLPHSLKVWWGGGTQGGGQHAGVLRLHHTPLTPVSCPPTVPADASLQLHAHLCIGCRPECSVC